MDNETLEKIVLTGLYGVRYQVRERPETHRLEVLPRLELGTVVLLTSATPIEADIVDLRDPVMDATPGWSGSRFVTAPTPRGPEDTKKVHRTFHKLWSQAAGTEGYVKDDWKVLIEALRLAGYPL